MQPRTWDANQIETAGSTFPSDLEGEWNRRKGELPEEMRTGEGTGEKEGVSSTLTSLDFK